MGHSHGSGFYLCRDSGRKAVSKHYSIKRANAITLKMGYALLVAERIIGRELLGGKK